jgi:hypothetical protein
MCYLNIGRAPVKQFQWPQFFPGGATGMEDQFKLFDVTDW